MFYGQSLGEIILYGSVVFVIIMVIILDIVTKYKSKY